MIGASVSLTNQQKQFLKNSSVKIEDFEKAKIDITLLMGIAEDYIKFSPDFLQEAEYIAKKLQRCKSVHSVRWRIKDVGHLVEKIIRKRCEAKVSKKYQNISIENYKSVITDLIGVRAIHLFKDEWKDIHQYILSYWKPNEKVVVYFRDGDNINMFSGYCSTVKHKAGYRSIHYIIPINKIDNNKISCEIQTRTLFEEGWSEIDHRVRYPSFLDDENLKKYLDIFNRLAGSADEMGSYVNSLVNLINTNNDRVAKIFELENKLDKLFEDNVGLQEIKSAFYELKAAYDEKEVNQILENPFLSKKSMSDTMKEKVINILKSRDIDKSTIKFIKGRGSHFSIKDKNGLILSAPEIFLNEIKEIINNR